MTEPVAPPVTASELERIVRETDRSAVVVAPRILRRVIKRDRGVTFLGWHGAHRESYAIAGASLRAIVEAYELGLPADSDWPETVSLVVRPDADRLAEGQRGAVLARYWRLLFHARVHAALDERRRAGLLGDDVLRARIARIGELEFDEVRAVLRQDGRLLPPRDDWVVYCEFAAAFLETRHFAPSLLEHEFPAIENPAAVESILRQDVDGAALVVATRLPGAAASRPASSPNDETADDDDDEPDASEPPEQMYQRFARRANAAAARGNYVRAAILWTRAGALGGRSLGRRAHAAARAEIDRLARRIQPAIGFDDAELDRWKRLLPGLLGRSTRGFWTAEARLLYDLQKVANDHDHEVFTVDLVEWIRSRGRRPLKRALPNLREVMVSNHLHRALRRLPATRLAYDTRERLGGLLSAAVTRVEGELRRHFRPAIDGTLAENDCRPHNLPERVAYDKLIEELLDRIIERGFLTLGDLRDAFSRSHLRFPDLSGFPEFIHGDRLLRIDSALSEALDGVYRRGEVYLRGLQRMSALAFGTRWGRFLTLYVVLPYGGTFVGLKGLGHLLELVGVEVDLVDPLVVVPLGTLVLGLLNSPPFRQEFFAGLRRIWQAVSVSVRGAYGWLRRQPLVRAVVESPLFAMAWRFVLKPAAFSIPLWAVGSLAGFPARVLAEAEGVVVVLLSLMLNSRLGRDAEEIVAESAARLWKRFWLDLVPGLFRWILMVFQELLEAVERFLYAVDEWLRFRSGQRRGSLVVKAVLGFLWFLVAYLVRFYVNLLIEPQVNPIKHFPVVTVSHKIILPLSKTLTFLIAAPLMPLGKVVAYFIAGTTVLLLPGIFGFLVWEMKENWRLYEANRAERLRPVVVGHHGETMSRLVRPGFHSGTIPKLFARLRSAERSALDGESGRAIPRRLEAIEHVEHDIARFLERDFLALLRGSRAWEGSPTPEIEHLALATNRIRVVLGLRSDHAKLILAVEERDGTLRATVTEPGWVGTLDAARRDALVLALRGLWTMSDVTLLAPSAAELTLSASATEAGGRPNSDELALAWSEWVRAWEQERAGEPATGIGRPLVGLPATA